MPFDMAASMLMRSTHGISTSPMTMAAIQQPNDKGEKGNREGEKGSRGEFCKHDTVYGGLQTFGTAVVAIESVALKSPSICKFGIARA
jgi:hypothetical protein